MPKFNTFDKVNTDWGKGRIIKCFDLASRYGRENTYAVRLDRRPYGHAMILRESKLNLIG